MMKGIRPRPAVLHMKPYSPPTGDRSSKLRLDFNENTVGCSPAIIAFLREQLNSEALTAYPDYEHARSEISAFFGVQPENMLLTNGTDEAIQVFINTYVDPGADVVMLKPSYAMYRFYGEVAGSVLREVSFSGDLSFPEGALKRAINKQTSAVLISNPNNPTGTVTTTSYLQTLLSAFPETAFLIDEAYFEFSGITMLPLLGQLPNLVVCRTFSKAYGLAAMRAGCIFSNSVNIAHMNKVQSPYSVNTAAVMAMLAAIRDREYVEIYAAQSIAARSIISDGLSAMGIRSYPSSANFVLFEAGNRAGAVCSWLRERGILVRDRSSDIAGWVRVTCGTTSQARHFLAALKAVWEMP